MGTRARMQVTLDIEWDASNLPKDGETDEFGNSRDALADEQAAEISADVDDALSNYPGDINLFSFSVSRGDVTFIEDVPAVAVEPVKEV